MKKALSACVIAASIAFASPAAAQPTAYTPGGYWVVQGIHIEPGQFENYMDYIADRYRANQDFARSRGWITGYRILVNVNRRHDEPDMYLITEMPRLATPQEQVERDEAFERHMNQTARQAETASGARVTMRRLGSNWLLQELNLRPARQ
ncbi:MAG TPA: hypothetical protein VGC46_10395 [Allosphingosinicella sp.]|jgi:hypothetical protein